MISQSVNHNRVEKTEPNQMYKNTSLEYWYRPTFLLTVYITHTIDEILTKIAKKNYPVKIQLEICDIWGKFS